MLMDDDASRTRGRAPVVVNELRGVGAVAVEREVGWEVVLLVEWFCCC